MELSPSTIALLSHLEDLSGKALQRRDDLGVLLEVSELHDRWNILEPLSFQAKFLARTFAIMRRIGIDGTGYDRLNHEFQAALDRVRAMVQDMLRGVTVVEGAQFADTYLAMSPDSLQNLLTLCEDLSWYKNWLIDRQRTLS